TCHAWAGNHATWEGLAGKRKWTDPLFVESFQKVADLWQAGLMTEKQSTSITVTDARGLFAQGKAELLLEGTWTLRTIDQGGQLHLLQRQGRQHDLDGQAGAAGHVRAAALLRGGRLPAVVQPDLQAPDPRHGQGREGERLRLPGLDLVAAEDRGLHVQQPGRGLARPGQAGRVPGRDPEGLRRGPQKR